MKTALKLPVILLTALVWVGGTHGTLAHIQKEPDPTLQFRTDYVCDPLIWDYVVVMLENPEAIMPLLRVSQESGDCLNGKFQWLPDQWSLSTGVCVGDHKVWMIFVEPDEAGRVAGPYVFFNSKDCQGEAA